MSKIFQNMFHKNIPHLIYIKCDISDLYQVPRSGLLEEQAIIKAGWKYTTMEYGERSAVTLGISMTQQLSVEALVSISPKRQRLKQILDKALDQHG